MDWISVKDRLPERSDQWKCYIIAVLYDHYPTSTYDVCDAPWSEEKVDPAQYDSEQKIWHLPWDECLNALIDEENAPSNGALVTHWMPMPEGPDEA